MSTLPILAEVNEAAKFVRSKTEYEPAIGIILGSGLGNFAELIEESDIIPYKDIPRFPTSTVPGHKGNFVVGRLHDKIVICMQGRFHLYEGYTSEKCTMPIRVMNMLGVKTFIMTNSCGGLNNTFEPGDIMLIKDHICLPGLTGSSPLVGDGKTKNFFVSKFLNVVGMYDKSLRDLVKEVAAENDMKLQEGVYCMQTGPQYETPAECRMMRLLGADVAGISTAHEAIMVRHVTGKVIGLSLVTDTCEMDSDAVECDIGSLHAQVLKMGETHSKKFIQLVAKIVKRL